MFRRVGNEPTLKCRASVFRLRSIASFAREMVPSTLTGKAGLRPIRDGARRASLHSFRHSFAVRRLRAWHEASLDVQALLPTLSVYLGHVRPEDTYWYLTATPDLLRAAGSRFTPEGVVGGAP
jgi:integrase/recombinase XerD